MAHTGPPAKSTAHTPLVQEEWKRGRREEGEEEEEEDEDEDFWFNPSLNGRDCSLVGRYETLLLEKRTFFGENTVKVCLHDPWG